MEFCKYCNITPYTSFCTCKINGEVCPFVRRCSNDRCYKPNNMENCQIRKEGSKLKQNEYKVRFCLRGNLFVEIENMVIEIKNPYNYVPEKVVLYKYDNDYHFKPKEIKKEIKTYLKKKDNEE